MALQDRLKELMAEYELKTQQELADFAEVSKGLVGQWFNGTTKLGAKPLTIFDKKTHFSTQWLSEGRGQKYKEGSIAQKRIPKDSTTLHLYDVAGSCGRGVINPEHPELLRTLEIPDSAALELLGTTNLKNICLMAPDGDSMEPTIPRKSITLIKTDVCDFQESGVYLFTFEGETFIKRLSKGRGGVIHVMSDNPVYQIVNWEIKPEELGRLIIHGKFWKLLPLEFLDI